MIVDVVVDDDRRVDDDAVMVSKMGDSVLACSSVKSFRYVVPLCYFILQFRHVVLFGDTVVWACCLGVSCGCVIWPCHLVAVYSCWSLVPSCPSTHRSIMSFHLVLPWCHVFSSVPVVWFHSVVACFILIALLNVSLPFVALLVALFIVGLFIALFILCCTLHSL